ncbi:Putative Zn-dependent protease PA5047 [hydrothermal vent metagenome]|uniref:Zn-dependent protease PA5047 n=1 Tax=hydrothermal vent metagenome TaxID=652676 RepID=A0A3B0TCN5_9ZZZZ
MVLSVFGTRLGGLAVLLSLSGCAQGLIGDAGLVPLMSVREEAEVGRVQHPRMLVNFGGAYNDPALDAYIGELTAKLANRAGTPDVRKVTVLNTPGVNAFALPGGYIYVTRGLLALANDEAELAMVIAHEIGHVAARHPAKRIARLASAEILDNPIGRFFSLDQARMIDTLGSEGYVALYSRRQEFEADSLGIRLAAKAGYLPEASTSFLRSMGRDQARRIAGLAGKKTKAQGDYMSAHPPTPARLTEAEKVVASLPASGERRREDYLSRIDGLVYGDARENGVVRGREFLQPVLGFAFKVPPGFAIHNRPNAIVALGPNRAVILFDGALVDNTKPITDYLTQDWADKIALTGVRPIRIRGLEAATGYASLGNREVRLVAIRQDGERIYRFIIMDGAGTLAKLEGEYLKFVNSFRQLGATEARSVQPLRIRVQTVRPGDTAESLGARMPISKRKSERFRVLNGLRRGEQPRVGQRVKLVVG